MLVIKMLKKASNKNNIELTEYLGKTRNTIASWEYDENNIPNTEKKKLSERFAFDYDYWFVGLDKPTTFYQKMYSEIKNGYLKDSQNQSLLNKSRIDEILNTCDGTTGMLDYYKSYNTSNEYNHYKYLNALINGIDPIDNSKLASNHFINEYKMYFQDFDHILYKFDEEEKPPMEENNCSYEPYLSKLKEWRKEQAITECVKAFQVLSDEVLENIVKAYKNNNQKLSGIKNFPVDGIKWHKYYETLIDILNES